MSPSSRRSFTNAAVLLGAGLFTLGGASRIAPLAWLERQAVTALAQEIDPTGQRIEGNGSTRDPWLRRRAIQPADTPPRVLGIDDDPEQWFSSSPLSPVDHALIFARLREAGHRVLGIGHLMAWDEAEPLAMDALRKQLDLLDKAVLALPLARGADAEPVPAPFLRMSLPESAVSGDLSALPRVNRVAVANAELGGERSLAGFSLLENEARADKSQHHLLARWNDRILFSFPLAAEMAALGISPDQVQIQPGKQIRLGPAGPVFPIDEFGRTPIRRDGEALDIPAMQLIREENPIPPDDSVLLTRDLRKELADEEKAWSEELASIARTLRSAPRFGDAMALKRASTPLALASLLCLNFFATWACSLQRRRWRIAVSLMVAALGGQFLYLLAARQDVWLPPLALLVPGLTAFALSLRREKPPIRQAPAPTPIAPEPETPKTPSQAPAKAAPAKKRGRKGSGSKRKGPGKKR
ncbi:MAG: hypothetical protein EAZ65_04830 [Verrucomicrobia bacterium]|nr:MAG: hypothetical protein EAZ84_01555 [Verrucomicrobiota bacterium]TAE87455.1 MAG: hypothetical protein EAZ82_07195 [Verrucomicrobiota bacterium]TAF25738.1 MAG: hypothetical protein EAZ71_06180 [Verrucomicrobiota bacterium]TAF41525.1 MAG: hypothetical protein EAZ65_04830 [Verrucomicrobiota bacterium]